MGLFGGNKRLCPICRNPAARLLPAKVEGQPLCSDCAGKASRLPDNLNVSSMTVEKFRDFIAFYNGNAALRSTFMESYQHSFGLFGGAVSLDVPHRLLRFDTSDNAIVFEASSVRSFRISEDEAPLFEGTRDALLCYQSAVPARVSGLGPEINRFLLERRQYEQMEHMNRTLEKRAKDAGESCSSDYYPAPDVDRLKPFERFYLRIELDHPYWSGNEYAQGGPGFTSFDPSITDYLHEYEGKVGELRELAAQLMAILNPNAPERRAGVQAASGVCAAPAAPAVAEIQKRKALLNSGVIAKEKFAGKKRRLLHI